MAGLSCELGLSLPIEGNIDNRNYYCIQIDYDDDNEQEEVG